MAKAKQQTIGDELAEQLFQAVHAVEQVPLPGARDLPILTGITRTGDFNEPQENVLVKAGDILVESKKVFTFGNAVVQEVGVAAAPEAWLASLCTGADVERVARGLLANLLTLQDNTKQFPPPRGFIEVLLNAEPVRAKLSCIQHYARRPVFDKDFVLRRPGWHADAGILVHGPEIEPVSYTPGDLNTPACERLPSHLKTILSGFCFRTAADLVNTIGMLLTGLLMHHFIVSGKPVPVVDGNQPNLGKTWLLRVTGIILDGVEPRPVTFTPDDEELQKRICATLREGCPSVLLIDNARVASGAEVKSPTIEAGSTAPTVSLRILGASQNYTRPNDLLWALTMNQARLGHDLVTRSLPIRLFYEGATEERTFDGPDPIEYAHEHRLDILGELAGMVLHWQQQGRPDGHRTHRLALWAKIIGGILEAAGFPEFLANASEAAAAFNSALDELAALAEAVIKASGPFKTGGGDS